MHERESARVSEDDRERINALLGIIDEHGLDALTVRVGDAAYEAVRRDPSTVVVRPNVADAPPQACAPQASRKETPPAPAAHYRKISAPIVGVFYRSSSPGAEQFVQVGDRVEVGQVVCILEAMKLMNEITSDHAGVVRRILPENGALVSLGEELMWIEA
jgi:acetyl-CoA carboxylase biotin carboxyl carrier protein